MYILNECYEYTLLTIIMVNLLIVFQRDRKKEKIELWHQDIILISNILKRLRANDSV